jgi:N-acetylmuramoyl-L-alanine amidase
MHRLSSRTISLSSRTISVLVLCLGVLLSGAAQETPRLKRISFVPREDGKGYVVRIQASEMIPGYEQPVIEGGVLRLVLHGTVRGLDLKKEAPGGPVRRYSMVSQGGNLVLTFQLDDRLHVQPEIYRDTISNDLLLSLAYDGAGPVDPVVPQPTSPDQDVRERWRLDTVVIDAGHGGDDRGAVGVGGVLEKDMVLAVALKLGRYLEDRLGLRVVYTRTDDRFIPLNERGDIANREGGKLFISIHANSAPGGGGIGTETYFLGMHKTSAAQHVMDRENSVIELESNPEIYQTMGRMALIQRTLAQSAYMRQSEQLAGLIERQFETHTGRPSRGVKQAGFYVLWGASMPAVLVELGFVTGRRDASFLKSESGQTSMANAIFSAVRDFKETLEKDLHLARQ